MCERTFHNTEARDEDRKKQDLICQARCTPASSSLSFMEKDANNNDPTILPSWIDYSLIKSGQDFARRHFFLVFFTHFLSLLLLLSYLPVKMVLLKTRRSHTKALSLKRYLSTLLHIKLWYEGDFSPTGNATLDVIKIQRVHSTVNKRLHDNPNWVPVDLSKNTKNSSNLLKAVQKCTENKNDKQIDSNSMISQLDMIVTQYCFMGLLTIFPERFGLSISSSPEDKEGLQGFIHLWAVIGHLLGIKEEFNLCIGEKSLLKEGILREILVSDLASCDGNSVVLWKALVSAMSDFVPCLSLHAAFLYFFEIVLEADRGLPELYKDASYYDLFCYKLTIILVTKCFRSQHFRFVFNSLLKLAIYITSIRLGLSV